MKVGLKCCGCDRVLSKGKPVEGEAGYLELDLFDSHEAADAEASRLGWQVADTGGANHRCPDCVKRSHSKRRGAYIYVEAAAL